ncbi:MAG: hypothetical protein QXH07_04190 [Thermoplasmata archaeon]
MSRKEEKSRREDKGKNKEEEKKETFPSPLKEMRERVAALEQENKELKEKLAKLKNISDIK